MYLDWDKKVAEFLPGVIVPLRPFPGIPFLAWRAPSPAGTAPCRRDATPAISTFVSGVSRTQISCTLPQCGFSRRWLCRSRVS